MVALRLAGGGGVGKPPVKGPAGSGEGASPGKGPAGSGEALSPPLLAGRSPAAPALSPSASGLPRGRGNAHEARLCRALHLRPIRL